MIFGMCILGIVEQTSFKWDVCLLHAMLLHLELRGYEKSSFRPNTFMATFKCGDIFKLKNEMSVSDEVSSSSQ